MGSVGLERVVVYGGSAGVEVIEVDSRAVVPEGVAVDVDGPGATVHVDARLPAAVPVDLRGVTGEQVVGYLQIAAHGARHFDAADRLFAHAGGVALDDVVGDGVVASAADPDGALVVHAVHGIAEGEAVDRDLVASQNERSVLEDGLRPPRTFRGVDASVGAPEGDGLVGREVDRAAVGARKDRYGSLMSNELESSVQVAHGVGAATVAAGGSVLADVKVGRVENGVRVFRAGFVARGVRGYHDEAAG